MSKETNKEDLLKIAEGYLHWESHGPFLIAFNNMDDLGFLIQELSSCEKIRISAYCPKPDSTADLDKLFNDLNAFAKAEKQVLLLGIGEHSALLNDNSFLNRIKNFLNSGRKLIVPIWQGYNFLEKLPYGDPRWDRMIHFLPKTTVLWSYKRITFTLPSRLEKQLFSDDLCHGFQELLVATEKGRNGVIPVRTGIKLNEQYGQTFSSPYELYCNSHPKTAIPKTMFSEEQWTIFLDEERKRDPWPLSADSLLDILENDHANAYMQSVVDDLESYTEIRSKFSHHIFDILDHGLNESDRTFIELQTTMKEMLAGHEELQKDFLKELKARYAPKDRLAYLNGNTLAEQKEILAVLPSLDDLPQHLKNIYPKLFSYLQDFSFTPEQIGLEDKELCRILDDYFQEYKKQKVLNRIFPEFLQNVEKTAAKCCFTLPSRGNVLERIRKDGAKLIWVDALGCEFLAYLQQGAEERQLLAKVHIASCVLPSITSMNRAFYDQWTWGEKKKIERLDRIKHGEDEEALGSKDSATHLASELQVLDGILDGIEHDLKHDGQRKVVLASDHGASRLAVIIDQKAMTFWTMTESGEHSGRCCKKNECDTPPPQDICLESDDGAWYVLTNYDRFKGSRQGLIEVHGGATLEEGLVPIIEFTLPNALEETEQETFAPKSIPVSISLQETTFKKSPLDKKITLRLVCPENSLQGAEVEFQGKRYPVLAREKGLYAVQIPTLRPDSYSFSVYVGQEKIKELQFIVESPLIINPDFDF